MRFSFYIEQLLKEKSGRDMRLPSDCDYLALDIETVTGEHIGVNTLKRLLGFIDDERKPRESTLDIIAQYLGFENWEILKCFDDKSNSSFDTDDDAIHVCNLTKGQRIEVSYLPDRLIELEYLGDEKFLVNKSVNSKLSEDDEIKMTHLIEGYPMLVSHVWREGKDLGEFIAGKAQGINYKLL